MTKGFITIATGDTYYKKLAYNLLISYRLHSKNPISFAILTDKVDQYTHVFDVEIVIKNPHFNYLDKIEMLNYLPFDVNVFLDADILAFGDLNNLFDIFEKADDFSCFGHCSPITSNDGWFVYEKLPQIYKENVEYLVNLHGGIYFIRNTNGIKSLYSVLLNLLENWEPTYYRMFSDPADEPLVALAMAINKYHPINYGAFKLHCWWKGEVCPSSFDAIHWGTKYTLTPYYKKELYKLKNNDKKYSIFVIAKYNIMIIFYKVKCKFFTR